MTKKKKPRDRRGRTAEDLCEAMERVAPTWTAAEWDNVGLLAGRGDWPAQRILLTIDLTSSVLDEAVSGRFDAIIAYHPPIFKPVKKFWPSTLQPEYIAADAFSRRIAIYSPHTALDAAPGGTNDVLAALCGIRDSVPHYESVDRRRQRYKLVTFVPAEAVDRVAEAMFKQGAGDIGHYYSCSFRSQGEGTFQGDESTSPVVGERGRFERVNEVRLEVVVSGNVLADVTAALRRAHPYEEPAFDIYPLQPAHEKTFGQGRCGRFDRETSPRSLARRLRKMLRAKNISIIGDPDRRCNSGWVYVGSAGRMPLEHPIRWSTPHTIIITGEIRHHDALLYRREDMPAIALGHWASERPVLAPLASRLRRELPGVTAVVSRADADPFGAV